MKKYGLLLVILLLSLQGIGFAQRNSQESRLVVAQAFCKKYTEYMFAGADDYFKNRPTGYSFDSHIKEDTDVQNLYSGGVKFVFDLMRTAYNEGQDIAQKVYREFQVNSVESQDFVQLGASKNEVCIYKVYNSLGGKF